LTVGDIEIAAHYDLEVNGIEAVNKFLIENEFLTVRLNAVNCLDGFLIIK